MYKIYNLVEFLSQSQLNASDENIVVGAKFGKSVNIISNILYVVTVSLITYYPS